MPIACVDLVLILATSLLRPIILVVDAQWLQQTNGRLSNFDAVADDVDTNVNVRFFEVGGFSIYSRQQMQGSDFAQPSSS